VARRHNKSVVPFLAPRQRPPRSTANVMRLWQGACTTVRRTRTVRPLRLEVTRMLWPIDRPTRRRSTPQWSFR
jgi:hypothetical protein